MLCKECNEPLPEGRRICRNCGTRNVATTDHSTSTERPKNCKDCGADLGGRRICSQCGARHFTTTGTVPPKEPASEVTKLCKHCNEPLPEGRRICRNCRTRNEPTDTATEEAKPSENRASTVEHKPTDSTARQEEPVKKVEHCPHCNQELIEGKAFCANCGEKVVKESPKPEPPPQKEFCTHCGSALVKGKPFCGTCGENVGGSTPPPQGYGQQPTQQAPQGYGQQPTQQAPPTLEFGQGQRLQRMAPVPQPVARKSFNPLFVVIPVGGLILLFMVISIVYSLFFGLDSVAYIQERAAFHSRPDITNEMILDFCSEGNWTEPENDVVKYQGNLYGSQSPIVVEFTIDRNNNASMEITYLSVDNTELGTTREAIITYYGCLFTTCSTGVDAGETQSSYFSLQDIVSFTMENSRITSGYDMTYLKMSDQFYPEGTWTFTPSTSSIWYADFLVTEEDYTELSVRVAHDTKDASSTVDTFYYLEAQLTGDEIEAWVKDIELGSLEDTEIDRPEDSDLGEPEENVSPEESTPQVEKESLSQEEARSLYAKLAQKYKENELTATVDQCVEMGLAWALPYIGADNLQYAFHDFDENGIPELVIFGQDGSELAVHTLSKASGTYEAVLLFTASEHEKIETSVGGYIAVRNYAGFQETSVVYELVGGIPQEVDPSSIEHWFVESYVTLSLSDLIYNNQSGNAGNTNTTQSINELDFYMPILDQYGLFYLFGSGSGSYDEEIVNDVFRWVDYYDFGTCFYDFDGDGIKELLVGSMGQPEIFYDLYTIVVETEYPFVKKVSDGGERYRYSMDGNTNLIYYNWAHSAEDSGVDIYRMNSTELAWQERLSPEKSMNYDTNLYSFPYEGIETYLFFP